MSGVYSTPSMEALCWCCQISCARWRDSFCPRRPMRPLRGHFLALKAKNGIFNYLGRSSKRTGWGMATPCQFHQHHRGAAAEGRGPPVLSIALESMVMVLDCPCLALEAQLIQNLLNKPLTKFGKGGGILQVTHESRTIVIFVKYPAVFS